MANLLVQYKSLVTTDPNETLDYKDSSTVPPLSIGMTYQLPSLLTHISACMQETLAIDSLRLHRA
eukprot:14818054-Ditylum_brightwellii.AAC.1